MPAVLNHINSFTSVKKKRQNKTRNKGQCPSRSPREKQGILIINCHCSGYCSKNKWMSPPSARQDSVKISPGSGWQRWNVVFRHVRPGSFIVPLVGLCSSRDALLFPSRRRVPICDSYECVTPLLSACRSLMPRANPARWEGSHQRPNRWLLNAITVLEFDNCLMTQVHLWHKNTQLQYCISLVVRSGVKAQLYRPNKQNLRPQKNVGQKRNSRAQSSQLALLLSPQATKTVTVNLR